MAAVHQQDQRGQGAGETRGRGVQGRGLGDTVRGTWDGLGGPAGMGLASALGREPPWSSSPTPILRAPDTGGGRLAF